MASLLVLPSAAPAAENQPPSANFDVSPAYPVPGEQVTFTSTSADPDGQITDQAWDLDGDGKTNDAKGETVTWTYAERGVYRVKLRVTDDRGGVATWFRTLTVNRSPTAAIEVAPANPAVGEVATFTSHASDPDGSIASEEWDLDNDGEFDDATGSTASAAFDAEGVRRVGVRVTDDTGGVSTWFTEFTVGAPGAGGSPAPAAAPPSWLTPFPTVRIAGRTSARGATLRLFSVLAPVGSTVVVRCAGKGCPVKTRRATVSRSGVPIRIRSFERRLRAGIVIAVRVTKDGLIGKYTRFRIRRVKAPARWEACLMPGASKPTECPAS